MEVKIPEHCPLARICEEPLDKGTFEGFCMSKSWVHCELAKQEASKFLKKAKELFVEFIAKELGERE